MSYDITFPDTTQGIRDNRDELVAALAALPEGTEMSGSPLWRGLVRGLDGYEMDQNLYADLFKDAVEAVDSDERTATFMLEQVDALRRQDGLWDIPEVREILADALDIVGKLLPKDDRRLRLEGLGNYHGSLIFRMSGDYERAADCQSISAMLEVRAGNPGKAATSFFAMNVERLSAAFMRGDKDEIGRGLAVLRKSYLVAADALGEDGDNWRTAQGPNHLLEVYWLARRMDELENADDLTEMLLASSGTSDFWKATIGKTLLSHIEGKWENTIAAADDTFETYHMVGSSSTAKAMCLNLLAKARAEVQLGRKEAAIATLSRTLSYREHHGGNFVKKVAWRELKALLAL